MFTSRISGERRILIVNSPYGPGRTTSPAHAARLIRRGRAKPDGHDRIVLGDYLPRPGHKSGHSPRLITALYDEASDPTRFRNFVGFLPDLISPGLKTRFDELRRGPMRN